MITIKQEWGGLGDNLQFSLIPEVIKNCFSNKPIIHSGNRYRNDDIYRLCWGINPNVTPSKQDGVDKIFPLLELKYQNFGLSMTQNWAVIALNYLSPLTPIDNNIAIIKQYTNRPIIHYKPRFLNAYKNKTVIDLNATSEPIPNKQELFNSFTGDLLIIDQNYPGKLPQSLFHYCDIIYSCKNYVCAFSGQSVLAAAIRDNYTCITTRVVDQIKRDSYYYWPHGNYINNKG